MMDWYWVGERGPDCIFPPFGRLPQEDKRSDWQKIWDRHMLMKRSTMAYKSRLTIELSLEHKKG